MTPHDPYTPWKLWAVSVLALIAVVTACAAHAKPVLEARLNARVRVTLHDEACTLPAVRGGEYVRAVWVEDGKPIEGCWAFIEPAGVVIFYFVDFTIGAIPSRAFHKLERS